MHRYLFSTLLLLGSTPLTGPALGQQPADENKPRSSTAAEKDAGAPGQGLPLPEGDSATIPISTRERYTTKPYALYGAPRSTRSEIASVDLVQPPGDPPTRLPDAIILSTNELVGATTIVLPLVDESTGRTFERRIEFLVIDEVSAAYKSFLESQIRRLFPTVSVQVQIANQQTAILRGFVDKAELVSPIENMVRGFLAARTGATPDQIIVVNALRTTGAQQVQLKCIIAEVGRNKMRDLGFDFSWRDLGSGPLVSTLQNTTGGLFLPAMNTVMDGLTNMNPDLPAMDTNFTFSVSRQGQFAFNGFLRVLEAHNLGKILAEPTLTTLSGQPAYFNSGGQTPVLIPQGNGTISIEYRDFGTNLRFVPTVLGEGRIRLEVRPEVSERDPGNDVAVSGFNVPAFRTRVAETTVELESGQTIAIAGLIQNRIQATRSKLPVVGDLPIVGAFLQRKTYTQQDTELLIMVTPHLADALDQRPCKIPGRESRIPNDVEYYLGSKFEPPCFDDPYRNHWQKHLHHEPMPTPLPVPPYDNWGRPGFVPPLQQQQEFVPVPKTESEEGEPEEPMKTAPADTDTGESTNAAFDGFEGIIPPPPVKSAKIVSVVGSSDADEGDGWQKASK